MEGADMEGAEMEKSPEEEKLQRFLEELTGKLSLTLHDRQILFKEMDSCLSSTNYVCERCKHNSFRDIKDAKIACVFEAFVLGISIVEGPKKIELFSKKQAIISLLHDFLLWEILDSYKDCEPGLVEVVLHGIYKHIGSNEDALMWLNYYVGQFLKHNDPDRALPWLLRSYDLSRTVPGKLYATHALLLAYGGLKMYDLAIKYTDEFRSHASNLQSDEYLFYCSIYQFNYSENKFIPPDKWISESDYDENFYDGIVASVYGLRDVALQKLEFARSDPVYEVQTYINTPNAPPTERLTFIDTWLPGNQITERLTFIDTWQPGNQIILNNDHEQSSELERNLQMFIQRGDMSSAHELIRKSRPSATNYDIFRIYSYTTAKMYKKYHQAIGSYGINAEGIEKIEASYKECFPGAPPPPIQALNDLGKYCVRAGKYDRGTNKQKQAVQKFLEVGFDKFSETRISHFEQAKRLFRELECSFFISAQDPVNYPEHLNEAVLWSERGKARDMAYKINNRFKKDKYLKELVEFDNDDDLAWKEIQAACKVAGPNAAFFIFTRLNDRCLLSYFLHGTQHPLCQYIKFPYMEKFLLSPIGRAFSDVFRDNGTFHDKEFQIQMFNTFIRIWNNELMTHDIKKIIIVPSEELAILPFAAFYDIEKKEYLIEKYAISYTPSLRMLGTLCHKFLKDVGPHTHRALVVGDPQQNLEGANEEADYVEQVLSKAGYAVKLLKGTTATRKNVLDDISTRSWIHIACHSVVGDKEPRGAFTLVEPSRLTYSEVANQELNAKVAFLFACSTAKGEIKGEGILGLLRAFHVAGVPIVVGTLWNIQDDTALLFTKRCYEHLRSGMDIDFAFQKALKSMLEPDESGYVINDACWAPFILSGSPHLKLL